MREIESGMLTIHLRYSDVFRSLPPFLKSFRVKGTTHYSLSGGHPSPVHFPLKAKREESFLSPQCNDYPSSLVTKAK